MNQVNLIGNLVRDPELRQTNSGIATCTFTIAINRPPNKDGVKIADYISIVTWRGAAENCAKYLSKGRKVAVTGEIRTRNYQAQDGSKRYVTEILANNVEFLTPRDAAGGGYQQGGAPTNEPDENGFTEVDDDELPF